MRRTQTASIGASFLVVACASCGQHDSEQKLTGRAPANPQTSAASPQTSAAMSAPAPPPPVEPERPLPPITGDVALTLTVGGLPSRRATVLGKTNLPEGTQLNVDVEGSLGWSGAEEVVVKSGGFSAGPFGTEDGLPVDAYRVDVLMPVAETQRAAVQAVLGPDGKNLRGPLVDHEDGMTTVKTHLAFRVGDVASAKAAIAHQKREAGRIYDGLNKLLASGTGKMKGLRTDPDPYKHRDCLDLLRENQAKAQSLEEAANALPFKYSSLATAAIYMQLCVCCDEETAQKQCAMAREQLNKARSVQ